MKKSFGIIATFLAAAIALAACNGSNNNGNPPGTGTNCGGPPNNLEVLYPRPNAQRAPDGLTQIFVATNGAINGGNYNFALNAFPNQFPYGANATSPFGSTTSGSIPSPHATPSYPNASYYVTQLQLPPGPRNTVQLYWNNLGSACTPNIIVSTFTTL